MYNPLPKFLTIKTSPIHGLGLFTDSAINVNTNLGRSHFHTGEELLRTPLGGFVNHSENPNVGVIRHPYEHGQYSLFLTTLCDISAGEELVAEYMSDMYIANDNKETNKYT